ncbi:hypothetical protein B566_EDAN017787, partial [Ephemera danica]
MFRCKNGQLTWGAWRCDGKDNCKDRSDEQNCVKDHLAFSNFYHGSGTCSAGQMQCDNG